MCIGCGSNSPIPRGGNIESEVSHVTTTVHSNDVRDVVGRVRICD
jgi:hypothetical protein